MENGIVIFAESITKDKRDIIRIKDKMGAIKDKIIEEDLYLTVD